MLTKHTNRSRRRTAIGTALATAALLIGKNGVPTDLDGDGSVGAADLLILLANWG